MQLIAGSKSKGGALDCNHGGLREQEPAQPVAEGVQGAASDGNAGADITVTCFGGSFSRIFDSRKREASFGRQRILTARARASLSIAGVPQ